MQSGLWNPLITLARLSRSCIRRLRMIQWESLTRTASAPASYAPPIAALASPVMYRRQVWYSEPFGRTSSGSVTPETPSISTETKTFTRFLLYPPGLAGRSDIWQPPVAIRLPRARARTGDPGRWSPASLSRTIAGFRCHRPGCDPHHHDLRWALEHGIERGGDQRPRRR